MRRLGQASVPAALAAVALGCAPAIGQQATPPLVAGDETGTRIAAGADFADRMTVPVHLNGSGPFHFVIDTAADRTVVSARLAHALQLPPRERATLYSITGAEPVDTAEVAALEVGGRALESRIAAVLGEDSLGATGMLGVDSLAEQRVVINFPASRMTVAPAMARQTEETRDPPGTIVVTARRRGGQLILTDASYRGHPIDVVIDTGSQVSIGNLPFRDLLARRHIPLAHGEVVGVTGKVVAVDIAVLPELTINKVSFSGMPVAYAGLSCFEKFGLTKRPALLLGMDVLRQFQRVAIDFKRREVSFYLGAKVGRPTWPPSPPSGQFELGRTPA